MSWQFFRFLSAVMKVHPIPHAIFETTRSGFIQILHCCSVSWKITPPYFFSSNLILWTKIVHWSKVLELLSGWVKIHKFRDVIFETTSHFFFKLHIMLQCHERSPFCTFLAETLYYFDEGSPSKYQISDLRFHQICTWIGSFCWKYIKFQLKITEELFLMTRKIDAKFE